MARVFKPSQFQFVEAVQWCRLVDLILQVLVLYKFLINTCCTTKQVFVLPVKATLLFRSGECVLKLLSVAIKRQN